MTVSYRRAGAGPRLAGWAALVVSLVFLMSNRLFANVVLFAGSFPPHIPLVVAAVALYPAATGGSRATARLAAAGVLAGLACDRFPFIWVGVILLVWTLVATPGRARGRRVLLVGACLVVGAFCAQLLWAPPSVYGPAVGTVVPRSGWVNAEIAPYLAWRSPWVRFVLRVLFDRSTLALTLLWIASGVLFVFARPILRRVAPEAFDKSALAWIVACAMLVTALAVPGKSFVACAAFVPMAILGTAAAANWMLARLQKDEGLEGVVVIALAIFQMGASFWPVAALGRLVG